MLPSLRTIDDELEDVLDLLDDEDYVGALPILARVTSFAPANQIAWELWTICHLHTGRLERALELVDEGLARGIFSASMHLTKITALRLLERFDEAIAAAEIARALHPESSEIVRSLAATEVARGGHDAALGLLQRASADWPGDEEIHFTLIQLATQLGRTSLVIESARDYLRYFEKDADVLAMLGDAYVAERAYRRADRAFRDAAHIEPDSVDYHVRVLMVAQMTGDEAAFRAYLERLASRDPDMARAVAQAAELTIARLREE